MKCQPDGGLASGKGSLTRQLRRFFPGGLPPGPPLGGIGVFAVRNSLNNSDFWYILFPEHRQKLNNQTKPDIL
jgi:hypothetical protein